jgi:branched-chain amino acid transport system permease protein
MSDVTERSTVGTGVEGVRVTRSRRPVRWTAALAVVVIVVLALLPYMVYSGTTNTLVSFFILLIIASMWNLLAGYAGLVSVGQQAYIGIGAYTVLFVTLHGVGPFAAIPIAAIGCAVLAIPISLLVFRLRGGYFAIGTWVVAEVYRLVIANTSQVHGGSGATITAAVGVDRALREHVTYWLALSLGVGSVLLVTGLLRTRLGLALRAVRDRESAAPTLGVDVVRTKLVVYVLASTVAGLTGAVIYLSLLRIQPDAAFSVNWTAFMIFAVVIGGIGTVTGPIVGTLLYLLLQQYLADLGSWYLIILGAVAIAVMLRAPRGLWGLVTDRWNVDLFPVRLRVRSEDAGPSAVDDPPPAGGGG